MKQNYTYSEVKLFNLRGVMVHSIKGENIATDGIRLDHLAQGCYIMKIKARDIESREQSFNSSIILK